MESKDKNIKTSEGVREVEIRRPKNIADGPSDGVMGVVECIRTDFLENPSENEATFQQRDKSKAHITASVKLGTFGIRDMESGVMLTVCLQDAIEVMRVALDASKEE